MQTESKAKYARGARGIQALLKVEEQTLVEKWSSVTAIYQPAFLVTNLKPHCDD